MTTPIFQFDRKRFCQILAVSLVLVVGAFALLQAVHFHRGPIDSLHCSVCLVAQHAAPIISTPASLPQLVLTHAKAPVAVCESRPSVPLASLFIRPPPSH
jgi:hypothetical protein